MYRRNYHNQGRNVQAVFNKLLNDEAATMRVRQQAIRFLEGMGDFSSKAKLLNLMTDQRKHGAKRLEEVLSFLNSEDDLEELLMPLLRHGINPETSKPLFRAIREKYLYSIYLVPGFINFLLREDIIKDTAVESAELLCKFLLLAAKAFGEARSNESVATLAKGLMERGDVKESETLCIVLLLKEKESRKSRLEVLDRIKSGTDDVESEVACWVTDRVPPGDRHSNDHLNYRDVSIIPAADELRCQVPSYLPLASGENAILEDPVSSLLDRNFRLLREDALDCMRSSIAEKRRPWYNARVIDVVLRMDINLYFLVQLDPPAKAVRDWSKARALNYQSVVAFLDEEGHVERIGTITVTKDDKDEGLNNPDGPVIGVSFEGDAAFDAALDEMVPNKKLNAIYVAASHKGDDEAAEKALSKMKTFEMIEVSQSFFAYDSILKGLQNLDRIPFQDELLRTISPADKMPDYLPPTLHFPSLGDRSSFTSHDFIQDLTAEKLETESTLDLSQARAVRHVLTNRVALIQGPPGTGKTFIGGLIARIILENTSEKILCVCYTNHALDQFLEHLIKAGKKDVVRLGSRTKSGTLEKYQLRSLSRAKGRSDNESSRVIKRIDAQRHRIREQLAEDLKIIESPVGWTTPNGGIKSALRDDYPLYYEHLSLPPESSGFQIVGKKGKKMKEDHLWNEWKKGNDMPPFALAATNNPHDVFNFWRMPVEDRKVTVEQVEKSVLEETRQLVKSLLKELKGLTLEFQAAARVEDMQILQDASIIGATTSGAAKYRDILSEVSPGVLMVEEAGEVLESHVLTSLSSESFDGLSKNTKHLILIGDHKQLRPKVDTYKLTKVSGAGYDLDVSLFERLILRGLQSSCLATQHRMRPTISAFVRAQTYPYLVDHDSVFKFPNIRGVCENVVFIDHDNLEDAQERDSLDAKRVSTTKSNQFESDLCVEIVRYLLLQGYSPDRIVVLTPYLGQLSKIIRTMRKELGDVHAYISEQDLENFEGEEQDELEEATKTLANTVRCSSVDNYQGEENDIVIASLVRCNKGGSIGFLKEPQRINVLLSRARHGMFIVGSSRTLLKSPAGQNTWSTLFDMMSKSGQIKKGLPTVCRLHPDDGPVVLYSKRDFRSIRPNGGCDRPCTFRLSCGHACPQMCHPVDRDHSFAALKCTQPCRRIAPQCSHQHPCRKLCRQECGRCQTPMGPILLTCGHVNQDITCHDARSPEAIEKYSLTCAETVEASFACGHVAETKCGNARSEHPQCPELCGHIIQGCQHPCFNRCGSCEGMHNCKQVCGRTLFCGHECGLPCHPGEECKPCAKPCLANCVHSTCPKPCGAACASCVEECDWECEHEKKCGLVCGAPCTRLPCNKRCKQFLGCGHRCPSVCGEPCPSNKYCIECGSEDVKSAVVDMFMMERYMEHDLDTDPVIVLSCGHFYGIETLDGHFRLHDAYEKSPETGEYLAIKSLLASDVSERPKQCPECRAPVTLVRRYGRILKLTALRSLERKHMTYIENILKALTEQKKKNLDTLCTLRKEVESSPMRRVQLACRSLHCAHDVEVPDPTPRLLLKLLHMTAKEYTSRVKNAGGSHYKSANEAFLEAIDIATSSQSWRTSASLRVDYVEFLWRWMDSSHSKAVLWEHLDWVINKMPVQMPEFITIAKRMKHEISSDKRELQEVIAAVDEGQKDLGFGGGGASGHWYECPNGHPYFIGDCGGAAATSTCNECGAAIGSASHRVLGSN